MRLRCYAGARVARVFAVHAAAPGTPACAGVISKSWLLRALIGGIMPPLRPTPVGRVPNRAAFILILCTARENKGAPELRMPLPRKQKQIAGLVALLVPYWLWVRSGVRAVCFLMM